MAYTLMEGADFEGVDGGTLKPLRAYASYEEAEAQARVRAYLEAERARGKDPLASFDLFFGELVIDPEPPGRRFSSHDYAREVARGWTP